MPLTKKFSQMYDDALVALAAASQRPATVVNVEGHYAIRVDLEYGRYVLATNSPRGLWDHPDASGSWWVRIMQIGDVGTDTLLSQAQKPWLIDAFDAAIDQLESAGHAIVADVEFGAIAHADERSPECGMRSDEDPSVGI
ncbi:hypothetical protein [Rhodococcus sp. 66b]|uniref:hypothetical protein n=1 Tax=Rhodococcus sp. 66b TaxID=1945511 RepID=UPI0009B95FD8|nr:hypothetical protein [Rhodococcus sp. 66b]OQM77970.1 hypothetical protein B0E55_06128 [Rhodococcus sp. 66b]